MNAFRPPLDYPVSYRTVEPANDIFEPEWDPSPWDDDSECVEDMLGWGGRAGLASVFLICVLLGLMLATGGRL